MIVRACLPWALQVVDVGNRVVRLTNAASGTFAQFVAPEEVGAAVVGSPGAALFKVIPGSNLGEHA
ncbi:hypothetical protein M405DRAFT_863234 [Rhizopogon salebrosus TDB-379]|nr:hypothetical protein M405DRAFT_863234 [Rhizopogon salebrosus TDB-379]